MPTVIPAGLSGKCGICDKEYPVGTRIAKDRKTGKWCHADCLWPDKKKNTQATPSKRESMVVQRQTVGNAEQGANDELPSSHIRIRAEADAEANLDWAEWTIRQRFNIPKPQKLNDVQLAAIMEEARQLHGRQYQLTEIWKYKRGMR